nr:reverse transcriptase domain-containing protein [Tanacetum cinerariifolium]
MPKYANFMKDLLTNKAKFEETSKVTLNERCFVVLLNTIPLKERDIWSFNIPCAIWKLVIDKALADLGVSISLMPYSMFVRQSPKDQLDSFLLKPVEGYQPNNDEIRSINLWDEEKEKIFRAEARLRLSLGIQATPDLVFDLDNLQPNVDKNPTFFAASMTSKEKYIPKLKELPSHLKYAFLAGRAEFSVIISLLLSKQEKTLLLQDKKGAENLVANHLSRLENPELKELDEEVIRDSFPNEHLMAIQIRKAKKDPWYANYANILVSNVMPKDMTYHLKKKFFLDLKYYIWDELYLFKSCPEGIIRSCIFGKELQDILEHYHTGSPGDITWHTLLQEKYSKKDSIGSPSSRML